MLCELDSYSEAMDVWSVGCVLGELIAKEPLLPGTNTGDQLRRIVDLIGNPLASSLTLLTQRCQKFMASLPIVEVPNLR